MWVRWISLERDETHTVEPVLEGESRATALT